MARSRRTRSKPPRVHGGSVHSESPLVPVLGLCALAGLAYANSFSGELFFDNATIIGSDPRIHAWSAENLRLILTKDYWWPLGSDLYRPLTTLSYLFNYAILGSGENAISYHVVNLLLHAANALFVLLIVWRLAGRLDTAWTAAALFVVLPVNSEAVTNVVGRADLLAALGVLAGGWCYLRAAEVRGGRRTAWLVATGVVACLAVLSKENAIAIVAFVVLYDWLWRWPAAPGTGRRPRLVPAGREGFTGWLALVPAVVLLLTVRWWISSAALGGGPPFSDNPIAHAPPWVGWLTAIKVLGRYLLLLVFPRTLSADYSYNQIPLYGDADRWQEDALAWVSLAVVAGLAVAAVWRRSAPLLTWSVLWFLLALLPTSNLLVSIGTIMAERFVYLPSVGFCVVAALALNGVGRWLRERPSAGHPRWSVTLGWLPVLIVVVLFAGRTYARNSDWREELPFWRSTLAAAPNSHKAHRGYARALWNAGQDETAADAALAGAARSLAILDRRPLPLERQDNLVLQDLATYATYKAGFLQRRGDLVAARHFHREAVQYLTRAVSVDRAINDAARARRVREGQAPEDITDLGNHRIYVQLANAYLALDETGPAWEASLFAQRLAPDDEATYYLAGAAAFNAGRPGEAAVQFLTALLIDAEYSEAWNSLILCYGAMGVTPTPVDPIPGGGYTLRADVPVARAHLTDAAVRLVAQLEAARRFQDAAYFRSMAVSTYHVPAEAFGRSATR